MLTVLALAIAARAPHALPAPACPTRVRFAGLVWTVSDSTEPFPGAAKGFAWNACNVRVESRGPGKQVLTLVLHKERSGWQGAQLETRRLYQYGTYSVSVETAVRRMLTDSPSAVLGFFSYIGPEYTNEIDVELTGWGVKGTAPVHYTVWPDSSVGPVPPPSSNYATGENAELAEPSLHRFIWKDQSVEFQSFSGGHSSPIGHPFKVTAGVPAKPMHIMLNFWVEPHANMGSAVTYEVTITSVTRAAP